VTSVALAHPDQSPIGPTHPAGSARQPRPVAQAGRHLSSSGRPPLEPGRRLAATTASSATRVAGPRRTIDLLAIAEGFAASATDLPELRNLPRRHWILLAATDLFEAWAIGWPPGGTIELHDHGNSGGAVVVAEGTLTETRVRPTDRGVALVSTERIPEGEHRQFGAHYVHDLINDGDVGAISVHVYSPKLETMTFYELDRGGRLAALRTELIDPVGPFDVTRRHDPS
jgi:hypothetical protein